MRWRTGPVDTPTFNRARAIVRAARVTQRCQQDMTAHRGRKRSYTYEALFTVFQIAAIEGFGELLVSDAAQVLVRLTPSQRETLGIKHQWSYDLVEQAVAELGAAFKERVDTTTGEVNDPRLSATLAEFMTSMASDFIPSQIPQSDTQAIDSTDYEAHARRRSWKHLMKADIPEDSLPELDALGGEAPKNEKGWPLIGDDGRYQHTIDPDARDGYRAGKNRNRKGVFCGWDLHLSVDVPDLGGDARPGLIRGASLVPAGTYKAEGGLSLIDAMIAADRKPSTILVDRGYTYLDTGQWARPVWARGIEQVLDLHTTQRGTRPGPIPGTIFVDGGLYKDTLPKDLRSLGGFSLGMSAEAKALLAEQYDRRKYHAFTPMGAPNYERATQRYRDPVLSGTMRCANHPASLRLDAARYPQTQCVEGEPCHCGTTVTLGPDDLLNLRQRVLYGTTKWKASYGRRSAVESTNACLKVHHARLARHSTRVRGTERNGILLSFILAAVNASLLLTRYGYDVGDPPQVADDEVIEPLPSARPTKALHRQRKFSRPRRAQAPPGPAHTGPPTTPWVTVKRTAKAPGKRSVKTK